MPIKSLYFKNVWSFTVFLSVPGEPHVYNYTELHFWDREIYAISPRSDKVGCGAETSHGGVWFFDNSIFKLYISIILVIWGHVDFRTSVVYWSAQPLVKWSQTSRLVSLWTCIKKEDKEWRRTGVCVVEMEISAHISILNCPVFWVNGKHSESRWPSFTVDSSSADNIEDDCSETTDFKWNEIVLCSRLSKIATNVSQIHWGIDTHSLSFFLFSLNPKGDVVLSCLPLHYRVRVNDRVPAMAWSFLSLSFSKMFSLTSLFPGSHVRLLIHATQENNTTK